MRENPNGPILSVALPVYNERENLEELTRRLLPILKQEAGESFEVIFVDDGSRDGSAELLDAFARDRRLKVIHFSRNFGHQAALQAGLDEAAGQAVVLMDADLQDPPEVLSRLVEKWRQGVEVVYAVRKKRREALFMRWISNFYYRTLRIMSEIDVPLDAGDFCLLDRRVVDTLVSLRERNRFLRGLRSWVGFKQAGVEYVHEPRYAGSPKYRLRRRINLAMSGYIGFSPMPLHLATWLGFLSAGAGFLIAAWAVVSKIIHLPLERGWVSTLASILFVSGVQLIMLGIIGQYLGRVYDEVLKRPLYIVRDRKGFP